MQAHPRGWSSTERNIPEERESRVRGMRPDLVEPPGEGSGLAVKCVSGFLENLKKGLGGFPLDRGLDLNRRTRGGRRGQEMIGLLHDSFFKPGVCSPVKGRVLRNDHHAAREAVEPVNHQGCHARRRQKSGYDEIRCFRFARRNAEPARGLVDHDKIIGFLQYDGFGIHGGPELILIAVTRQIR